MRHVGTRRSRRRRTRHRRRPARRRLPLGRGAPGDGRRGAARTRRAAGGRAPGHVGRRSRGRSSTPGFARAPSRSSSTRRDRRPAHRPGARRGRADAARAAARAGRRSRATAMSRWPVALAASKLGHPDRARSAPACAAATSRSRRRSTARSIDRLGDVLFTDSDELADALECEGIDADARPSRRQHRGRPPAPLRGRRRCARRRGERFGVEPGGYVLATLHRPENALDEHRVARDRRGARARSPGACRSCSRCIPRRARRARADRRHRSASQDAGVHVTEPLGYLDFLSLRAVGGSDPDRLRRRPGRGLGARRPLLHAAPRDRARSSRSRTGPTSCSATTRRRSPRSVSKSVPVAPASIPLWDGRAGDRIAAELTRRMSLQLAG